MSWIRVDSIATSEHGHDGLDFYGRTVSVTLFGRLRVCVFVGRRWWHVWDAS